MPKITIDHVLAACEWAAAHRDNPGKIGGRVRRYDPSEWDCGTSCCVWGAASLLAGVGPAEGGPRNAELGDTAEAQVAIRLLRSSTATPEHIAAALRGECDENGNWNCTHCTDCRDCAHCAHCTLCANCTHCTDCTLCRACWNCTDCWASDCSDCSDCWDCMDCTDCTHCTHHRGIER